MPFESARFTRHGEQRIEERGISKEDIRKVLARGEIIKEYPDDTPRPSYLMLGWAGSRPLHVLAADKASEERSIIITAYEPDAEQWESNLRTRKP